MDTTPESAAAHALPNLTITPPTARPERWASRVALAGMVARAGFFTVMMVLGFVTPGYDWVARYGSELSLGRLGWIMIASFIVLGVAELAVAVVLGRMVADRVSGWVSTAAVALIGAAFVTAGVAFMAVVIFFIATPVAGLAAARRFGHRRGFARYCVLTAVGTPALLVATFASRGLLGLTERIVIAVVMAWLTSLAAQIHRGASPSIETRPRRPLAPRRPPGPAYLPATSPV